jgi:hypothetical protein
MGLDWHSSVRTTEQDKIKYIEKYYKDELDEGTPISDLLVHASEWKHPCDIVGATKMKDRHDFDVYVQKYVDERKAQAEEGAKNDHYNQRFVEHWRNATYDSVREDMADRWDCENCPLLKKLNGADSTDNLFLGVTVSSCDFRGKRISADTAMSEYIINRAYEDMSPDEMLEYAYELEAELEMLRGSGALEKDSYKQYSDKYDTDPFPLKDKKMTLSEYSKTLHWREQNIKDAVHWLRTCAEMGVSMTTSY